MGKYSSSSSGVLPAQEKTRAASNRMYPFLSVIGISLSNKLTDILLQFLHLQALTFAELYEKYNKQVFNLVLQYVQNQEDAAEITQDVFVKIHQSLEKFNHQANLSTWIYRISINASLDFIKSRKRKKRWAVLTFLFHADSNEIRHEAMHFDHPGVELEQKEATERIFEAINRLPDKQKTALILSKIEHKSQVEVAQIMDLSPKAVESLIQRAKNNLSQHIKTGEG